MSSLKKKTYKIASHQILLASNPKVMTPSPYSLLLARYLPPPTGDCVLDLGTGSGILAILLAKQGWKRVVATDINPHAVELVKVNAHLNSVADRVVPLVGNLFTPVTGERCDAIVCNPPSLPMPQPPQGPERDFYYAGPEGRNFLDQLITRSPKFLKPGGVLVFVNTSLANVEKSKALLTEFGFDFKVVARKRVRMRAMYLKYLPWFQSLARDRKCSFIVEGEQIFETLYVFHAVWLATP